MPSFRCDLAQRGTALRPVWKHTVGSGHAALALRRDWQAQLARCRAELGVEHVRFHGILCDDVGVLTVHEGAPVYAFYNVFQIYDGILEAGLRPFVELSFMPGALASGRTTVFKYRGHVTPPRDLKAWAALVRRFAAALVDRYGAAEVRRWYFEVWNEPNLRLFWTGTQADYFALYRHTVEALKGVDAGLRVGGPATAQDAWIEDFLAFAERERLPVDFVSTHHYPNDGFGAPGDDTEGRLAAARRGILCERAQDAVFNYAATTEIYTEWNVSSDNFYPRQDTPYAAAFVAKTFLEVAPCVEAYAFWVFSDLFEEQRFPSAPFHGGFGLLTIHGVAKPTYRAVQLLGGLGDERLLVDGLHATVDCAVVRGAERLSVLLTNHAFPRQSIAAETVHVRLDGAAPPAAAYVERIDEDHANPRRVWEAMGAPANPTGAQLDALHAASTLVRVPLRFEADPGGLDFSLGLPAHAVACVTLEYPGRRP